MIRVSRLDGTEFVLNAELIELIEMTPDTVLTLTDETKFIVREPVDEVVARVIAYRRSAYAALPVHGAPDLPA
ncbi:MAG TPA: flagellar FlbD family protein [Chloroflexota bacterium]|jgi:flagellar protein FlbD